MLTANEARVIADKANKERKDYSENLDTEIKTIIENILKQIQEWSEKGYCYYWYTFPDNDSASSQVAAMQALRDLGYSASFRGFKGYLIRW